MLHGIVDADTHVNEPPDLWLTRLPARFREDAPRIVDAPHGGKAWAYDRDRRLFSINMLVNVAGISPVKWQLLPRGGYDDLRPGAWDPAARIADMDIDMVDVHTVFPTYGLGVVSASEPDLQVACVQAYNDWLSEFCCYAPERLAGMAMAPHTGVEDALAELERARRLPGIRAILLRMWPNGGRHPKPEDGRFWSALEDLDLSAIIHIGFGVGGEASEQMDSPPERGDRSARATLSLILDERSGVSIIPAAADFIVGGVLERHPRLRVAFVEAGIGWVPFFLEQADDAFLRHRFWTRTKLSMLPSEYWQRQCYATFLWDRYGLRNRDLMGAHTLMWSSDYPHSGADWPDSRRTIAVQMQDIPEVEQRMILSDNARRLYGLAPVAAAEPLAAAVAR